MKLRDFYSYPDGRFAMSKFWGSVAYAVATWIVIRLTVNEHMTYEILLVYLGTVGSAEVAKKLIEVKYKEKKDA